LKRSARKYALFCGAARRTERKVVKLPIAREGWPFVLAAAAILLLCLTLRLQWASAVALLLSVFVAWFFRDPERSVPEGEELILSPADGRVIEVRSRPEGGNKIGIFLSIFDVHVNRLPVSGRVAAVEYRKGRFLAAWKTIASDENERCGVLLESGGESVRVVQVAGLVARRIICRLQPGETVRRGERYGLIRFGSRVDIYLPAGAEVTATVGDKVKGGSDVIARWR
jgi:phosphatidylserine decarboxylase